ncbi:hypothetical protein [Mesoterricola silvestris]|uniref:hypothetical protein n=1 Tax=Mesoterricola silvestris TaxID=2927979 RepID=UPI00292CE40C|nr:hypothetical protein [Mesoterricola silvestris]
MSQSEFLTKETLLKIGFTGQQATDLGAAHITASDLVAATMGHEFYQQANGGDSSAVQAGVVTVMNRVNGILDGSVREGEFRANKGVTQDGLSAASQTMLKVITAPGQYHSLTGSTDHNRGKIAGMLLGNISDAGFSAAQAKMASYANPSVSMSGFRQIWSGGSMVHNIGSRMSFHRNRSSTSSEPGGIVIGPNVFY